MGKENISNKKIVLTGASSGIGMEILKLLSAPELNNTILAVSRHAEEKLSGFGKNVIPFNADIGSKEDIDRIFARGEELFGLIDIFYNNAGFPYLERYDYLDWHRMEYIFDVNTLGPVYMYSRYIHHLNGRPGYLCYTISCIGLLCLPGYALYTASKFGLRGFQQAIRHEKPDNLKITCLYPVGTSTNFWSVASDGVEIEKKWPVMKASSIARKMVRSMETGRKQVYPLCWEVLYPLMVICPPVKNMFWKRERDRFERNIEKIDAYNQAHGIVRTK